MDLWFNDWPAVAIVLAGTLIATVLRCGVGESANVVRSLAGLGRRHFDEEAVRQQLARQIQEIGRNGILAANPRHSGDAEFDAASDALIDQRSVAALIDAHDDHRARRMVQAQGAVRVLMQAAELAPVFGLAGTLVALTRLPANGIERSAFLVAIGMAVHATLYGLVLAHLLLVPLAGAVERAALAEERARQAVVEWLTAQLARVCPMVVDAPRPRGAAAPVLARMAAK